MRRDLLLPLLLAFLLAPGLLFAQDPQYAEIEEEDEDIAVEKDYTFNPIQAKKELRIGDFYWKKKSFRAASLRYSEATKWDPGSADAFWKLAQAKERLFEQEIVETKRGMARDEAIAAYNKFIELKPKGKKAKEAQEKVAELKSK
jgi:hypothetical protein